MTLATKTDKQATKIDQANYLVELKRKHSARFDEQVFLLPFFCVMPFERCVFFSGDYVDGYTFHSASYDSNSSQELNERFTAFAIL